MLLTKLICELGLNHLGDIQRARRMIDALVANRIENVTFQAITDFRAMTRVGASIAWLEQYALTPEMMKEGIIDYAGAREMRVGATIADPSRVRDLVDQGIRFFKILSSDLSYSDLIEAACETGLPVYLSTGAATLDEIGRAVQIGRGSAKRTDLRLIHTVLTVPTPLGRHDLRNITTLRTTFGLPVAYGQHGNDDRALHLAIALGVESLFVYVAEQDDPTLPDGPNAIACSRLGDVVDSLRSVEEMLGGAERILSVQDEKTRALVRRSVVAAGRISAGEKLDRCKITYKRPGSGMEPWNAGLLLGKTVLRDVSEDEDLLVTDVSEDKREV